MFALIAVILAGIAAVEPRIGEVSLLPLAVAFLALHHVVGEWSPWRR